MLGVYWYEAKLSGTWLQFSNSLLSHLFIALLTTLIWNPIRVWVGIATYLENIKAERCGRGRLMRSWILPFVLLHPSEIILIKEASSGAWGYQSLVSQQCCDSQVLGHCSLEKTPHLHHTTLDQFLLIILRLPPLFPHSYRDSQRTLQKWVPRVAVESAGSF